MDSGEVLNTSGFVSKSMESPAPGRSSDRPKRKRRSGKRRSKNAAFVLVRLGVCAAALSGVLWFKLRGGSEALAVMKEYSNEASETADPSSLGKLKFVELPSILDVFAPSDSAVVPVNALGFELEGDEGGLIIKTSAASGVICPLSGRVKAVGTDAKLGKYVSVMTDGDIEFAVYGLDEVTVEQGQPVKQRQKLGTALADSVTVRAWRSGRPLDTASLLGIGKAG